MKINKKAFTILEMGVVIICISFFMRAIMKSTAVTDSVKNFNTEEKLRKIDTALENYIKTYGHLPCPSNIKLKINDSDFGISKNTNDGECQISDGLIKNRDFYVGGVPTYALGINNEDAIDSWGNKIIYSVGSQFIKEYKDLNTELCVVFIGVNNNYSKVANVYYAIISNGKNKFAAIPSRSRVNTNLSGSVYHKSELANAFLKSGFANGTHNCVVGFDKSNKNFDDILRFGIYNGNLVKKINKN